MLFGKHQQEIVISEADIEAAMKWLRSLPHRADIPVAWDRMRLIQRIKESVGTRPDLDKAYAVAPGVFAMVKPFGVDLMNHGEPDGRLQVWIAVRAHGTDPARVVTL